MPRKPDDHRDLAWGYGSVERTSSNRWQARWREDRDDGTTKHAARTFATKDEAEDYLRDRGRKRRDGKYIPPSDMTVNQLIAGWLERGRYRWSPSTYHTYRQRTDQHIIPALGSQIAINLDTPRIQQHIDHLARSYSPALVDAALQCLRAAYREAVRIGIVAHNPASAVQPPKLRRKPVTVWSAAEAATVLQHVADAPLWATVYRLMLTTGMRPGECRALRWGDLERSAGTLRIQRTMSRSATGEIIVGATTKTGKARTVTLPASTLDALTHWRTAQLAMLMASGKRHTTDYLFTTEHGSPLSLTVWQRQHATIIAATGVTAITLHGLRHTAATLLMGAGVSPRIVADMLGHASIATTLDQYSHVNREMLTTASDTLERLISG